MKLQEIISSLLLSNKIVFNNNSQTLGSNTLGIGVCPLKVTTHIIQTIETYNKIHLIGRCKLTITKLLAQVPVMQ